MGADLYIESITNKARAEHEGEFHRWVELRDGATSDKDKDRYQKEVDKAWDAMYPENGYFRDSYNDSNLLWQFGLSWWQDIPKYMNKKGYMPFTKAGKLRDLIASKELPNPPLRLFDGENAEEAYAYFAQKKQQFLAFLNNAVTLKEAIRCSI